MPDARDSIALAAAAVFGRFLLTLALSIGIDGAAYAVLVDRGRVPERLAAAWLARSDPVSYHDASVWLVHHGLDDLVGGLAAAATPRTQCCTDRRSARRMPQLRNQESLERRCSAGRAGAPPRSWGPRGRKKLPGRSAVWIGAGVSR